jgi:hypothetical protein
MTILIVHRNKLTIPIDHLHKVIRAGSLNIFVQHLNDLIGGATRLLPQGTILQDPIMAHGLGIHSPFRKIRL